MKYITYILTVLTLYGCENSTTNPRSNITDSASGKSIEIEDVNKQFISNDTLQVKSIDFKQIDSLYCDHTSLEILRLKDKNLQTDFFNKLDSVLKKQYPNNDQEKEIFVDITQKHLNLFLNDIIKDSLTRNNYFQMEYHFNIAPEGHDDPETCTDNIMLTFEDKYCRFILSILNTFLVEPNWCTESLVTYYFEIKGNRITNLSRLLAG